MAWASRQVDLPEAKLMGEKRRRGENRLGDPWEGAGERGEPYPAGTVEGRWVLDAGLSLRVGSYGTIDLDRFIHDITTMNKELGAEEMVLSTQLGIHFRPPAYTNR